LYITDLIKSLNEPIKSLINHTNQSRETIQKQAGHLLHRLLYSHKLYNSSFKLTVTGCAKKYNNYVQLRTCSI